MYYEMESYKPEYYQPRPQLSKLHQLKQSSISSLKHKLNYT